MDEKWKPVVGFEKEYEVSNLGRVRSLFRYVRCCGGAMRSVPPRILKPGCMNKFGHVSVMLGRAGGSRCVHELVLEAFVGKRPKGFDCCHKNGDGGDNRLENLRWASRSDNNRDVSRLGRRIVNMKQVQEMRRRARGGETATALAAEFGMCVSNACYIIRGDYYV